MLNRQKSCEYYYDFTILALPIYMEKKITISNNSKIVAFFDELNKRKEETRKKLEAKMIKAGLIPNTVGC